METNLYSSSVVTKKRAHHRRPSMSRRALIVGGGIGGLAAALACSRAGAQVELFERSAEFAEVGAGIQLSPNGVKVLHD